MRLAVMLIRIGREEVMEKKFKQAFTSERLRLRWLLLFAIAFVLTMAFSPATRHEVGAANASENTEGNKAGQKPAERIEAESRFTKLDGTRIHYLNYNRDSGARG